MSTPPPWLRTVDAAGLVDAAGTVRSTIFAEISALATEHGLTDDEYARVLDILGRTPTYAELGIYSVMWSEHCSYKNSIALLKTLPRDGEKLLAAAGDENAGLVDIGDGLAVVPEVRSPCATAGCR